ncbi:MAG: GspH/FimT family pseudopilin [Arenimonas sp.]
MQRKLATPDCKLLAEGGFSMVELLIAISISAILLAMAIPSFTSFLNSNRVTSQANELLANFQVARLESIRRGARVVVCGSGNANAVVPTCSTGTSWSGWIAFVDANRDNTFATSDGDTLLSVNALSGVTATASTNVDAAVVFRPDGLARTTGGNLLLGKVSLCIATTTPLENARDVTFTTGGGSLRVDKRNASASCTAPSN